MRQVTLSLKDELLGIPVPVLQSAWKISVPLFSANLHGNRETPSPDEKGLISTGVVRWGPGDLLGPFAGTGYKYSPSD